MTGDHPDSLDDPRTNVPDGEVDLLVLFAGAVDPEERAAEWRALFGEGD